MDQAPGAGTPGTVTTGGAAGVAASADLQRDLATLGLEDLSEIASGGFATVYRAHQPTMGRDVAVKVLTAPVTDPLVRSRFARECHALGLLSDHPAIVTVFEAGFTDAGRPYLVMELMTGGSLTEQLQAQGPLPWPDVLTIGVRIAGALHSAHHHGVLHRDVKPANILISAYGAPKLGDFGIARLQGVEHTRTGALTGSLAHAAPELLGAATPSERSDVYALGSTLFTLLRGETAFLYATDESIIPALARITTSPIPDLRPAGIPDAVCEVVEQLMAKRPEQRPESAADAGRLLQRAQRNLGVPVVALPVPHGDSSSPAVDTGVTRAPGTTGAEDTPARSRAPRSIALAVVLGLVGVGAALVLMRPDAPAPAPRPADVAPRSVDLTQVATQLGELRGVAAPAAVSATVLPRAAYDQRVRDWATAGREEDLRRDARILAALHLVPAELDLVEATQELAAEQFLGFSHGDTITVRGDAEKLTPLQQSIAADEVAGQLLGRNRTIPAAHDRDAQRALDALHKGDVVVTAAAWSERHLTPEQQQQRATELSAQPDHVARGLAEAVRAELVFPYVAGEQLVRALFDEDGVASIEEAYGDPPVTTEQVLHPEKYRAREPALPVRATGTAPPGWTALAEQTFGEFDLQRLTAASGPRRSAAAAAGWGGGELRAWQRDDAVAVRISLLFDTAKDARQACRAIRGAHQRRTDAVPAGATLLVTPTDAFALQCDGMAVDAAVAPDRATATALLEP